MKKEFSLTLEDYQAFHKLVQRKSKRGSNIFPLIIFVLVVVSCVFWLNQSGGEVSILQAVLTAVIMLFAFFVYRRYTLQKNRECQQEEFERSKLGASLELYFDEDILTIEQPNHKSVWRWAAFRSATKIDDMIYLWFSEIEAILIPARAFENENDAEAFLQDIRSRLSN